MGKPVGDTAWSHSVYNEATNAWTTTAGMWSNLGHVYGNSTIDPGTGDVYCARGGWNTPANDHYRQLARYNGSAWGYAPSAAMSANVLVDVCNGVAFHPNLYGTGDGGICLDQQFRTMFWRKSNDTSDDTSTHAEDAYGNQYGCGVYHSGMDAVFLGGAGGNGLLKITPGPTLTALAAPPIPTEGNSRQSAGHEFGSHHVNPSNAAQLLIVSTTGTHYWTSSNGTSWTDVGTHPFSNVNHAPRVLCAIPAYGVIWAIGNTSNTDTSGFFSVLWKP